MHRTRAPLSPSEQYAARLFDPIESFLNNCLEGEISHSPDGHLLTYMKAESIKSDKDTYIDLSKYLDGVLSIVDQLIEMHTQSGMSFDSAALKSYFQAKESLLVQLIPELINKKDPEISNYTVKMIFSAFNWAKQLVASTPRSQLAPILLHPPA